MNDLHAPKLRFKMFTANWKNKPLSSIAELTSSKRVYLSEYVSEGIPFYRGKEISELREGKMPDDILYISKQSYEKYKTSYGAPEIGDILITAVGTIGNTLLIEDKDEFYFKDGNLIWIRKNKENPKFIDYSLQYNYKNIVKTSIGSSQKALTIVNLKKLPINLPEPKEQKKIADFLSLVDKYIQNLKFQKEELGNYKKGLMQKIFSQEIGFKSDVEGWEKIKLKDLIEFHKGKGISKDEMQTDGVNKCIRYGELYTDYKEIITNIKSRTGNSGKKSFLSHKYDVLMPSSGETAIDIATASCVLEDGVLLGGDINVLRPTSQVYGPFLAYYISSKMKVEIAKLSQGYTVAHLYSSQLKDLRINLPTKDTQKKIADFLIKMGQLAENTRIQLVLAEKWKSGLMQEMFV